MWLRGVAEFARGVGQLIYPNSCLVCDAPEADGSAFRHGLCGACHRAVNDDPHCVCPWCAATVGPHTDVSAACPACRGRSFGFARAFRLGPYDGRLKDAILRMKSLPGEPIGEMLGRVLAERLRNGLKPVPPDVIVPVPLYWRKRWTRGYNQAESVARGLEIALHIPCQAGWLRRAKEAAQHTQPSAAARHANIRGAFRCRPGASLTGRTVLLVDDVMTTGSTVGEAARVLREAGAASVVVAVLARA